MMNMDAALSTVLEQMPVLPVVALSIDDPSVVGSNLGVSVVASAPFPPFAAAVMDGYAMCAADGAGDFEIAGSATAGVEPSWTVSTGIVSYITTGAMLPEGASICYGGQTQKYAQCRGRLCGQIGGYDLSL